MQRRDTLCSLHTLIFAQALVHRAFLRAARARSSPCIDQGVSCNWGAVLGGRWSAVCRCCHVGAPTTRRSQLVRLFVLRRHGCGLATFACFLAAFCALTYGQNISDGCTSYSEFDLTTHSASASSNARVDPLVRNYGSLELIDVWLDNIKRQDVTLYFQSIQVKDVDAASQKFKVWPVGLACHML